MSENLTFYRVPAWGRVYECSQTRRVVSLSWVPMPLGLDSSGYLEMMETDRGPALYGAWMAVVQVAAKTAIRGALIKANLQPHTAKSLSIATRISEDLIVEMLNFAESIGWIDRVSLPKSALETFYRRFSEYWERVKKSKGRGAIQNLETEYPLADFSVFCDAAIAGRVLDLTDQGGIYSGSNRKQLEERRREEIRREEIRREEIRREEEEERADARTSPSATAERPTLEDLEIFFENELKALGGSADDARIFRVYMDAREWSKQNGEPYNWRQKAYFWLDDRRKNEPQQIEDPIAAARARLEKETK